MSTTAALVPGHFFISQGSERYAGCECGVRFEWSSDRDVEHARHLLSEAIDTGFDRGFEAGVAYATNRDERE